MRLRESRQLDQSTISGKERRPGQAGFTWRTPGRTTTATINWEGIIHLHHPCHPWNCLVCTAGLLEEY